MGCAFCVCARSCARFFVFVLEGRTMHTTPSTLLDTRQIWIDNSFISDSDALYTRLVSEIQWDGRIQARKSASFGRAYNYSGIEWPEVAFPESISGLLVLVSERLGYVPNNCLANYYPDGNSTMGFHADATHDLVDGTGIAVLSLGEAREISFRKQSEPGHVERYWLHGGALLYMCAEMQLTWKHAILANKAGCGGRISLTFRCMKSCFV